MPSAASDHRAGASDSRLLLVPGQTLQLLRVRDGEPRFHLQIPVDLHGVINDSREAERITYIGPEPRTGPVEITFSGHFIRNPCSLASCQISVDEKQSNEV